jgi:hypothetical protein
MARCNCVCEVDGNRLLSACGLHSTWLQNETKELQYEIAALKAEKERVAALIDERRKVEQAIRQLQDTLASKVPLP